MGLVGLAVLWRFIVSRPSAEADRAAEQVRGLASRGGEFFPEGGKAVAAAEEGLDRERETLGELDKALEGATLKIPDDLASREGRDPLYFQTKLRELMERVSTSGLVLAEGAKSLGFSREVSGEVTPEYLARLAVMRHIVRAANEADVEQIMKVEQVAVPGPAAGEGENQAGALPGELPVRISVLTDEKGLIGFVQSLSQPEEFLALRGLRVEVKDPSSGAFEAYLELAAVLERPKVEPEPEPLPVEEDGDQPIRMGPRRRRY